MNRYLWVARFLLWGWLTSIAFALLPAPAIAASTPTFAGDTSRPATSTFAIGEIPRLTFNVTGLQPGQATSISLDYRNEDENSIAKANISLTAGADGAWTGSVNAPAEKLGFYRVYATLADGTKLDKLGSRGAGYLTYAIVPDPAKRVDYGASDSMFGMSGGFNKHANIIPYLGVRWVYSGWSWKELEPDRAGQFAESRASAAARGAEFPAKHPEVEGITYGGRPYATYKLACANGVPQWAALSGYESGNSVLSESGEQAWARYCREIGSAFLARDPDQSFRPVQLTWEPSYPWNWKGTDEQLVRIYQIAYPILHEADPHALVVGPTTGWPDDKLFKAGLGRYLDGFTIHNYETYPPELNGYVEHIRTARQKLRTYTGRDIPIYGTEQGYATKGDFTKELDQARSNIRDNLISLGEGFKFNFAFYVGDYPSEPGYGYFYNLDLATPWGADKLGPKPSVPAYAAMTSLIDGHRPTQTLEWLGPTALGYAFQRGPDVVLALWDYGGAPSKVTLPVGAPSATVYDWMGNPAVVKTSAGGELTLMLTPDPIYVKGVSPRLYGATALRPLSLENSHIDAFPGERVSIKAAVADASGGAGQLMLEPGIALHAPVESRAVTLSARPLPVNMVLALPKNIPVGEYSAQMTLRRNGLAEGATGLRITVRPPVDVSDVVPAFRGNTPLVNATLTNRTAKAIDATVELRLLDTPGGRPVARVTLAPSRAETVTFNCASLAPAPNRSFNARITTTTGSGYRTSDDFNITFSPVAYAPKAPSLDSSLADWSSGPEIAIAGRSLVVRSPEYYNGKLAARTKFAWDSTNLYLAFDVTDTVFIQDYTGFQIWKGDCLQLEFNLDPGHKFVATGNEAMDKGLVRASEINVALTSNGPEAYRALSWDTGQAPIKSLDSSEAQVRIARTPDGLRYRLAIPWKTLGAIKAPSAGQIIGLSAYVNDMNQPGQLDPTALGLYASNLSKDPARFGSLVLQGR